MIEYYCVGFPFHYYLNIVIIEKLTFTRSYTQPITLISRVSSLNEHVKGILYGFTLGLNNINSTKHKCKLLISHVKLNESSGSATRPSDTLKTAPKRIRVELDCFFCSFVC